MRIIYLVFALFLSWAPAHAETYWVSPSGGATVCANVDGDSDPGAYMTLAQMDTSNCAGAGDTVMFKAGTYTGAHIRMDLLVPSGTSAENPSQILCEGDRTCTLAFSSQAFNFGGIMMAQDVNHFVLGRRGNGFIIDAVNAGNSTVCVNLHIGTNAIYTNVTIEGHLCRNHHGDGITSKENQPAGFYTDVKIRYNTMENIQEVFTANGQAHQIYAKGRGWLVEYNDLVNDKGFGIQCWHIATDMVIRYNNVVTTGRVGFVCQDSETQINPTNNLVYGNVFRSTGNTNTCMRLASGSKGTKLYNNTCIGYAKFVDTTHVNAGTNSEFKNNVCTSGTCAISILSGTDLVCGGTCSTTNPTVTAASHFLDAANSDVSLIAGSSLINAGLDVGLPYNGSAPDIGAHETFGCTTATITGNAIDLTCAMNDRTPINPVSGTTGWSVGCTGTGCGSPTVTGVALQSGTSTRLRIVVGGITGGNCEVGQTWTVTYDATTGSVFDAAAIGGVTANAQRLHAFTNLATANACTGSGGGGSAEGPTYSGTPYIHYRFNANANDSSGGARHGTATGITYVDAQYQEGAQTDSGVADSIALPYMSGVDPSSQSLTLAFGVFIDGSDLGTTKDFGGTIVGTNQRFILYRHSSGFWRFALQDTLGTNTEFAVTTGWTHACVNFNAATDVAKLHINGVAGTIDGASTHTYTSFTFPSNFNIGLPSGFATSLSGSHIFDEFILYQSVESCAALYALWNPSAPPLEGTLSQSAARIYSAKANPAGTRIPLAAVNTATDIASQGAFAVVAQVDCAAGTPCTEIGEVLYYTCSLCPSGGTELTVPSTPGNDGISFFGSSTETGLITGDHGALLIGSKTRIAGGTKTDAGTVTVFSLDADEAVVNGRILRFSPDATGRTFCFYVKEQSGAALDSVTPSGGLCVTARAQRGKTGY